jgi:predicted TIM-barrel fold metal-dependent hydrolase
MVTHLNRRQFLGVVAAAPLAAQAVSLAAAAPIPIIDTHFHMFDRTRPQGAFWPPKDDLVPGMNSLPPRYRAVMRPYPIVGAIAVEASAWIEDNQWVLDQAQKDPIILGHVGFLEPGTAEFGPQLERFHRNKLYLGIRYSNRNNRQAGSIQDAVERAEFIDGVKMLADAGLSLDMAMPPDPASLLRLTDKVPSLRLIVPHLPGARMPEGGEALAQYEAKLRELAHRPHVFMKLTEVIKRVDGTTSTDLNRYRGRLDLLWDTFGEDRVLFGSDWPNNEHVGTVSDVMSVALPYITSKGPAAAEKVYWRNSLAAYRWTRRDSSQPKA